MSERALEGLRVIECGELVAAAYATKLLADLGADVIKVEPPGNGDAARYRGPFPGNQVDPEKSGLFLYLNTNKRAITLDLRQRRGQEILRELVGGADLLVHNFGPHEMTAAGIDYPSLSEINPKLILVSIAPFGLEGPHSTWATTDLTLWNAGGIAYLNGGGPGTDDMPPLKAFGQQAGFQGGLNAAIAALAAVFARGVNGAGQHVVISIQECLAAILELTYEYYPYMGLIASRLGHKPIQPLDFLECKDGWIFVCCVEEHQWQTLVDLMGNPEWTQIELFENRIARAANWDACKLFLQEWASTQSVSDLYHAGQARRIPLAPVSTMADLLTSDHLKTRGFFAVIDHPKAGRVTMPGAPYGFGCTPWELRRPAPLLGQHNDEIFSTLLQLNESTRRDLHAQGVI
ncbi:MAG: CoA transferase [Deltaproteobacteria bacterium]|nr:CoA transferase [Deltaproteobacteria bacterium]